MNDKHAKKVRAMVRRLADIRATNGRAVPERDYIARVSAHKSVFTGEFDAHGMPVYKIEPRITRHCHPDSVRGAYRALKKHLRRAL